MVGWECETFDEGFSIEGIYCHVPYRICIEEELMLTIALFFISYLCLAYLLLVSKMVIGAGVLRRLSLQHCLCLCLYYRMVQRTK